MKENSQAQRVKWCGRQGQSKGIRHNVRLRKKVSSVYPCRVKKVTFLFRKGVHGIANSTCIDQCPAHADTLQHTWCKSVK